MGLRCSLLGHAFGEAVTERERETRGAEVLITVREVRRCSRCDAEQVITENKEIRHLGGDEDAGSTESTVGGPPDGATPASRDESTEETVAERDHESEKTGSVDAEQGSEPAEAGTGTNEADADSAEVLSTSGDPDVASSDQNDVGSPDGNDVPSPAESHVGSPDETDVESTEGADSESSDEAEVDVSDLVDAAEEPDAGGPGRTSHVGEAESADTEVQPDEDVEIIGADTEEESQETGSEAAADSTDTEEPKPPEDAPEIEESDAAAESETDAETEPEDTGPPEDDAIILDNEEGKDARESDVGRRELAGSGNMFDPSAPENEGARETPSDQSGADATGDDSETWPGREVEGRADESSDSAQRRADPTEWPASEPVDEEDETSDSSFQFDQDRLEEEADPQGKTPSGLTSEGPVDVAGEPDDSPPKSVECPECGYTAEGVGSSLRAGDICPKCHDAYLADRR